MKLYVCAFKFSESTGPTEASCRVSYGILTNSDDPHSEKEFISAHLSVRPKTGFYTVNCPVSNLSLFRITS